MVERFGGCLCGQLRFTVTDEPMSVGPCHCKDCQKQTASAFAPITIFAGDMVKLQGESHMFTTIGEGVRRSTAPSACTAAQESSVSQRAWSARSFPSAVVSMIPAGCNPDSISIVIPHNVDWRFRGPAWIFGAARNADLIPTVRHDVAQVVSLRSSLRLRTCGPACV